MNSVPSSIASLVVQELLKRGTETDEGGMAVLVSSLLSAHFAEAASHSVFLSEIIAF